METTINLFESPNYWYWVIGIAFSAYQATRGIIFQLQGSRSQKKAEDNEPPGPFAIGAQSKTQIWLLRAIADGFLYLLSTFAGFVSLMLAYRILVSVPSLDSISGGTSGIFVFLALFGLLGATGQLPHLLQQGKWPR